MFNLFLVEMRLVEMKQRNLVNVSPIKVLALLRGGSFPLLPYHDNAAIEMKA